jgi:hypothetical protein
LANHVSHNDFQNLNYNLLLSYDENLCVDKIIEWSNMRQIGFEPFKVRCRIDSWNSTKLQAEMCNFIVLNSLAMARHKLQHTNWAEPMKKLSIPLQSFSFLAIQKWLPISWRRIAIVCACLHFLSWKRLQY